MRAAINRVAQDLNANRELGWDLLRIYLGLALFVRGGLFLANPQSLLELIASSGDWFWPVAVAHYVAGAHLVGGALLAFGAYTRLAAAVQIPVLAGAVFVTHWGEGLMNVGQSLELAGLVFVMLIVYAVFGAGPLSIDARIRAAATKDAPPDESLVTNATLDDYASGGAR